MSARPSSVRRLRSDALSVSPPPTARGAVRGLATAALLAAIPVHAGHAQSPRPLDVAAVGDVSSLIGILPDSLLTQLRAGSAASELLAPSRARADSSDRDAGGYAGFWGMFGGLRGPYGTRTLGVAAVGGVGGFGLSHLLSWSGGGAPALAPRPTNALGIRDALASAERASAGSRDAAIADGGATTGADAVGAAAEGVGPSRSLLRNDAWRIASGATQGRGADWRAPRLQPLTGRPTNDWRPRGGDGVAVGPVAPAAQEPPRETEGSSSPLTPVTSSEPTAVGPSDPGTVASLVAPEPTAITLVGGGLVLLGGVVRRRRAR